MSSLNLYGYNSNEIDQTYQNVGFLYNLEKITQKIAIHVTSIFLHGKKITLPYITLEHARNCLSGWLLVVLPYSPISVQYDDRIYMRTKFEWLPQDQWQKRVDVVVGNMPMFLTIVTWK